MPQLDPDNVMASIRNTIQSNAVPLIAGPGDDDCTVFEASDPCIIATTDYMNSRPILMELSLGGLEDLGRLLAAANISDLLGSGAKPTIMLVSLMFPRGSSNHDFDELMRGIASQCEESGVSLAGGDTKLGNDLIACATAIGTAPSPRHLSLACNAGPGDRVWSSGALGGVGAALSCFAASDGPFSWKEEALRRIKQPVLPYEQAARLRLTPFRKSGTDLSDGLCQDLDAIMQASGVGFLIEAERIPVDDFVRAVGSFFGIPAWSFCFATGGDFQFVCTAGPQHDLSSLGFCEIGTVTPRAGLYLEAHGRRTRLTPIGHRDVHNQTFQEEVRANLDTLLTILERGG